MNFKSVRNSMAVTSQLHSKALHAAILFFHAGAIMCANKWRGSLFRSTGSGNFHGPDLVLLHGKIWTGEPASPQGIKSAPARFAEAVAIANGRILAGGKQREIETYIGGNTRVIDLKGRLAPTVPPADLNTN